MTLEQRIREEEKNLRRAERDLAAKPKMKYRLQRAEAKRMLAVLKLVQELPRV